MDERLQRLQGHRLKMAVLSIFNVLFQGGVMALFAWVGTIPVWPVVAFFAVSASTTVMFALIVRFNLNLRMKDQNLLTTQIVVNFLVQIIFLILVPQIAVTFLVAMLVIFVYAAVLYTPRQYTVSWIVFSLMTGVAIYFVRDRFGYPGTSGPEIAIIWLFFCLALRRLMLASSQYSSLRSKLSEKNAALQASLARIEELASHDELTGCLNRRRLGEMLCDELRRAGRTGQGFAFAILDLDHFKSVNDRYGHPAGDAVLKKASKAAIQALREVDRFGRMGGEEFGILLPATSLEQGSVAMERIGDAIRALEWENDAPGLRMTCSIGITVWQPEDTIEAVIKRADIALYEAKSSGRDKVIARA